MVYNSVHGFDIYREAVSIPNVSFSPGTYWFELYSGTTAFGANIYWDENGGPSLASQSAAGRMIPSETFQILGTTATPEPASFGLIAAGLIGMGVLLRKSQGTA